MSQDIAKLIALSKSKVMSKEERERQRRSFAYGNTKAENDAITRQSIDQAAESLATNNGTANR